jgi:hypothetical protein
MCPMSTLILLFSQYVSRFFPSPILNGRWILLSFIAWCSLLDDQSSLVLRSSCSGYAYVSETWPFSTECAMDLFESTNWEGCGVCMGYNRASIEVRNSPFHSAAANTVPLPFPHTYQFLCATWRPGPNRRPVCRKALTKVLSSIRSCVVKLSQSLSLLN